MQRRTGSAVLRTHQCSIFGYRRCDAMQWVVSPLPCHVAPTLPLSAPTSHGLASVPQLSSNGAKTLHAETLTVALGDGTVHYPAGCWLPADEAVAYEKPVRPPHVVLLSDSLARCTEQTHNIPDTLS